MLVHLNGVELEYAEFGTGVPVVFSHGGGSDLRYWEPQREAVAARYRFVAYSHRFKGRGRWPAHADASADEHTNDLVALMRFLAAGPVHLVGFSSAIALRAAIQAPDLVRSLTVIEPNVPWLLERDPEGEAALAWWRAENARVDAEAAGDGEHRARLWFELVNNRGAGTFDAQPEAFRRMWLDNFGATGPQAPPPSPLTCTELGTIKAPTLALGAGYGMPFSRRIIDIAAGCIGGSDFIVIPSVTHFMSYQEPDKFNAVLLDFIGRH
jgi:pimeloyl-ACP methyl ester carboxylesterase